MIKEGSTVPRKGHTQKRDVLADPLYNNKVVTKDILPMILPEAEVQDIDYEEDWKLGLVL